jgi:hypothetical protein
MWPEREESVETFFRKDAALRGEDASTDIHNLPAGTDAGRASDANCISDEDEEKGESGYGVRSVAISRRRLA